MLVKYLFHSHSLKKLIIFFFQNQFLKRLLILFVHLFCLSTSVYLRTGAGYSNDEKDDLILANIKANTTAKNDDSDDDDNSIRDMIRYCSEIATLICVLSYVIFQQGDEIRNQGLSAFSKQMVNVNALKLFFCFE